MTAMRICICGGGNLGHVCAGFLANRGHQVSILTTKPERWNQTIEIAAPDGTFLGQLAQATDRPDLVIPDAEVVLVCLPGYAIQNELAKINTYLSKNCLVGTIVSSTGFFFEAFKTLSSDITLFGFQRVPFISRIVEYGKMSDRHLSNYLKNQSLWRRTFTKSACRTAIRCSTLPDYTPCGRTGQKE